MALIHQKERIEKFVHQYDIVQNTPVLTDITEVNNAEEGKLFLGSSSKYIRVIKDYNDQVFAFLLFDNGVEEYLDVIHFDNFDHLLI